MLTTASRCTWRWLEQYARSGPGTRWRRSAAVLVAPDVRNEIDASEGPVVIGFFDPDSDFVASLWRQTGDGITFVSDAVAAASDASIRKPARSPNGRRRADRNRSRTGSRIRAGAIWYVESAIKPNVLVRFDLKTSRFQSWMTPGGGDVVRNIKTTDVAATS